ncbi:MULTISPECIES: peptide ABC transporter substrate-binding protein [Streptomyces]|uniref:ABC transporter substrate-binding protein n=2 Tax=Streptomyces TaxID=1883 RepID=A0A3S9PLZ8_STRLT|nr:ABC transporter substrate-binding protein [Streptomyces luteoverticillatus]AZQ73324.1 ABC transporter substrate-binding protein [Streptomyces luteoverticillatus]
MRGARSAKWVTCAIVVALAATACGGDKSDSGGGLTDGKVDPNGTITVHTGEPQNALQPANAKEQQGHRVLNTLFSTLVTYESGTAKIVNVNAESVTSSDAQHWTVKLKPGWKFHNGETVTAQSYVDSWNWSANTKNNQINSNWFSDIEGFDDLHPAEKGAEPKSDKMSGLKVVNDNEFTITLKNKVPYFNYKLGYIVWAPLPQAFFKDPKGYGEKPVGNGPYKFDSWAHNDKIVVKRFDGYTGPNKAKNGGITFKNYTTADAAYNDLRSDNLDWIEQIPDTSLTTYKQDLGDRAATVEYSAIQDVAVAYYSDQWKSIDNKVVQGLSMAVDRETITKNTLHGTRIPANSFVAKGVLGYQANSCGEACTFNPEKAKQLIKEGGGVPGNKISIQYNADLNHKPWVDAVCNSIRTNTGVDCVGDSKPNFKADLDTREKKQVKSLYRSGWNLDYPVNANFLRDLYGSKADGNQGGYENKEFDELAAKADNVSSLDESVKLYQDAEKVLTKKLPVIPLWYYAVNSGQSTKVYDKIKYGQDGEPLFWAIQVKQK